MITSTFGSPSGRQPSADVTGEGHLNFARRLVAQERNRHIGKFKAAFVRAASGAPDELLFKDFTRRRMTLPRCPQDGGLPSACDSRKVTGRVSGIRRTGLRLAATIVKAIPTMSPGQRKGGSVSSSPAKRSLVCSERCIRNLAARQR